MRVKPELIQHEIKQKKNVLSLLNQSKFVKKLCKSEGSFRGGINAVSFVSIDNPVDGQSRILGSILR
ncbi:hypothetical protein NPIL_128081 [Nephila pilipes]|uniref:Uncharacterized protein n=1 Tax=Nephila pilipes TaxID=299642 RepID=A0A8X6TKS0_NEPPI|nr:hypothetical protein NPIL_128081 [Nephila pilipes]